MAFWASVLVLPMVVVLAVIRDGELVTREPGTRLPKRFSSTLEFSLVSVLREKRKLLLDKLFCPATIPPLSAWADDDMMPVRADMVLLL
uniref:Putative secreted protein n=1 Tax=Anopheles darlingi TaxID=43151 RepID=A0A2M4DJ46_ANODA